MNSIRIDRERAIRTGALVALVLLAVSFLPELLRRPEPPALPANVGFGKTGTEPFDPLSGSVGPAGPAGEPAAAGQGRRTGEPAARPGTHRHRRAETGARAAHDRPSRRGERRRPGGRHRDRGRRPGHAPADASAPGSPAAAPVPAAPVPAPTPMPAPAPPPAPSGPPGDGSEEFAPR